MNIAHSDNAQGPEVLEETEGFEGKRTEYRGKSFSMPTLSAHGFIIVPDAALNTGNLGSHSTSAVVADLGSIWDLNKFKTLRRPLSVACVSPKDMALFSLPGMPRILDMPIKFPGTEYRVPKEYAQLRPVLEMIAHHRAAFNIPGEEEFYAYLTVDQSWVEPGILQREAPCHVDGFQGARWNPKVRLNHTYTIGDAVPTTYYEQPFDFDALNEKVHNFFWEMNRIVALTKSRHAITPEDGELTMMDAYCVHRGSPAPERLYRTWIRLSFEVRKFDRLGNAHNPMFDYNWEMVPRDIESLNLKAFDESMDPSLRVFPWQDIDGKPLPKGAPKTKPNLLSK